MCHVVPVLVRSNLLDIGDGDQGHAPLEGDEQARVKQLVVMLQKEGKLSLVRGINMEVGCVLHSSNLGCVLNSRTLKHGNIIPQLGGSSRTGHLAQSSESEQDKEQHGELVRW